LKGKLAEVTTKMNLQYAKELELRGLGEGHLKEWIEVGFEGITTFRKIFGSAWTGIAVEDSGRH
jgi:hypothetical protein